MKQAIQTNHAPAVIGCYSQAIKTTHTLYLAGQIPLDPATCLVVEGGIKAQVSQVLNNLKAVAQAAGTNLDAIVKLTIYLLDMAHLSVVNEVMLEYFSQPYPARTSIAVAALPKGALVEMDAIVVL